MFQKYTTKRKNHLYNLEVVKVTTQEAEQCKTRFSSYTIKTGVQTRLKLLSVQSYRRACKWYAKASLRSWPRNELFFSWYNFLQ